MGNRRPGISRPSCSLNLSNPKAVKGTGVAGECTTEG